ncbi:hypothetical protein LMH87_002607 [Akanthomyces muscarius]|uniref:Ethylene receptor n=1 Tax=Akanthomyces muscarius TaxID=2231603 RepID=A0A9W8Q960_AKAMU|nr:hypothetical protein LMH87_002607 [Akanthomyces muscarius]KAJ4148121.1 hypothetical protein LMH87_002607 [Akanthomyces muscarius]
MKRLDSVPNGRPRHADNASTLNGYTVTQLLECDPRPTLVVALNTIAPDDNDASTLRTSTYYANPSLLELAPLHQRLKALFDSHDAIQQDLDSAEFVAWAGRRRNSAVLSKPSAAIQHFAGYKWTRVQLGQAFCVLSADGPIDSAGDLNIDSLTETRRRSHETSVSKPRLRRGSSVVRRPCSSGRADHGRQVSRTKSAEDLTTPVLWLPGGNMRVDWGVNWTEMPLTDATSNHVWLLRSMDWSASPLGPVESWHWDLRAASDMLIRTPYPAAIYWGPEFVTLYNEPYVDLAGDKHPELLGTPYAKGWAEIWHLIEPVMLAAWDGAESTMKHNDRLFILRGGFLEETFFSWSLVPLLGSNGQVAGIFNAAFETTQQVVNERRLQTLQEIGAHTATAKTLSEFWVLALQGMAKNEADFPFCLLYSNTEDSSDGSSFQSNSTLAAPFFNLEGSLGVPDGHASAPQNMDAAGFEGFAPYMRQSVANNGNPIVLSNSDGTLPAHLIEGIQWLGFGEPSRTVIVFAVTPMTPKSQHYEFPQSRGFIVLGANPRRPYDSAYELFIQLLMRQLGTSLASVLLFEDQVKRSEREARLAALDRQQLSLQLRQRTQEAVESELKFARMAEYAPVGIFIANSQGSLTFCNGMWWKVSRQARISGAEDRWMENIVQADKPVVADAWDKLLTQKMTISAEFRFRSPVIDESVDTWVLMSAFPEKDHEGNIRTIFGCITDISAQKEAENIQSKRREEALELKRQQENFIDITSHEMRNPLSAILQCADQIVKTASNFAEYDEIGKVRDLLHDNADAAKTINLCASHQKRIVDDILTLSKLDSKLMTINPVSVQPIQVVERVLTMFEPESNADDIKLSLSIDESYSSLGVDTVSLDPSRLQQVLINLMTNAIKFTKGCAQRTILVTVGAGHDGQGLLSTEHSYLPAKVVNSSDSEETRLADQQTQGDDWVCLHFTVQDSGPGLDEEDLKVLFQRFQQASPRTHVQYGGSGLGLFISRLLVDMMGGEIGVCSNNGSGSRFFFYIKCRKLLPQNTSPAGTSKPEPPIQPHQSSQSTISDSAVGAALYSILIVEDNLINQRVLKRQLLNAGHIVHTANHGKQALEVLEKSSAWHGNEENGTALSVILMDIEMPVMDGLTCSRRIRELEAEGVITRHLPIIAVTAYARPEQIENAKVAGVDDLMPKPFRIVELVPKITELVHRFKSDE